MRPQNYTTPWLERKVDWASNCQGELLGVVDNEKNKMVEKQTFYMTINQHSEFFELI